MLPSLHITRKWLILLIMSSAFGLINLNQTGISVALPVIQHDLNLSNTLLLWIVNAYLLALSALTLLAGKVSDCLGHKRVFLAGMTVFTAACILGTLAQSGAHLIVARCLEGIGSAFILSSTSAVIVSSFPQKERGKALGTYAGLASLFLILGPVIGGAVTQYFGWNAVFWTNIPIAIIDIVLAAYMLPNFRSTEKMILDYWGILLSIAFINGFILYFMEAPRWGWTAPISLALFFFSSLSVIAFIFWERQCPHPLLDIKLFKNSTFASICVMVFIIQTVAIISYVFWAAFLQRVFHYLPLSAGLHLIPALAFIIFLAPLGGHLCDKYGHTLPMACGCLMIGLGFAWIGFSSSHYSSYLALVPGLVMFGIGMPLVLSSSVTTLMSTVSDKQRGITSAIFNGTRTFGNSIGLAVFGGILNSLNTSKLLTAMINRAPEWLTQIPQTIIDELLAKTIVTNKVVSHLPSSSVAQLKTIALKAYTDSFSTVMFIAAVLACICLLITFKIPRRKQ